MVKTTFIAAAVALLSTYVAAVPVMDYSYDTGRLAPLYIADDAEALADSYIVVLKNHVNSENAMQHCHWVRALHNENSIMAELLDSNAAHGIKHAFDLPKLKGYSGKFSKETLDKIRQSEDVSTESLFQYRISFCSCRRRCGPRVWILFLHWSMPQCRRAWQK